jgi:hypothetical protein
MKKHLFIFAVYIALFIIKIDAQNYSVTLIPDSLKENAHCVIRDFTKYFELKSINSGIESIKKVITILDKDGESKAYLYIQYDKNSKVTINQISIFDASGKKIKTVKSSEILDSPAFSESGLYSDNRTKFYKPDFAVYPYTIEYDYEINSTNLISYGCWRPITNYDISVQHAQLNLSYPINIKINKKEVNYSGKQVEIQKDGMLTNTWELNNLKAIEDEPFDISIPERTSGIYLMPNELIYDDFRGVVNNWEEYGIWVNKLFSGRDELSEIGKLKVNALLKDISDPLERIRTLYTYMQENTRYVAITLGIGGYQPFSAKTVFETGYGDCKALSNYMYSLLKFIGVKSYPALVSSGRYIEPIFKDFPNFQQFDHEILCVPFNTDTIWLECTNQKMPFGFLGDYTDNRDVLLITPNGGQFAHTKKYLAKDNVRISNSYITIDSTGTATCSIKTKYQGLQYDDIFDLLGSNYEEQKKWLYKYSTLPSTQITGFSIINSKKEDPVASINENVISRNYCSFSDKYMLLPLNLINGQKPIKNMLKTRVSDVLVSRSFTDYDTLTYQIPENYKPESVPLGKSINSNFGEYSCSISVIDNKIVYTRKFLLNQGRYKPSEYKDIYKFILSISKADNVKIILIKRI